MITEDLIVYIQTQLRKNTPKDIIISRLLSAGWHRDDVDEAFAKINPPTPSVVQQPTQPKSFYVSTLSSIDSFSKNPDPYREKISPNEPEPKIEEIKDTIKVEPKIELKPEPVSEPKTVTTAQPVEKQEPVISNTKPNPETDRVKPIFAKSFSEANPKIQVEPIKNNTESKTQTTSQVHPEVEPLIPPLSKKAAEPIITTASILNQKSDETKIEIRNEEIAPVLPKKEEIENKIWTPIKVPPKVESIIPPEPKKVFEPVTVNTPISPNVEPVIYVIPENIERKVTQPIQPSVINKKANIEVRNEELIPPIKPKTSISDIKKNIKPVTPTSAVLSGLKMTSSTKVPEKPTVPTIDSLASSAMIYSYKKTLQQAIKNNEKKFVYKKHKLFKWLPVILIIIVALTTAVFLVSGNYIKLPSFIKKDPKTLLINAPVSLGKLKYYKIETNATISLPPLANITSGLVSGQAVVSNDKDYLSLSAKGVVNHENESMPVYDYNAIFSSSLFKDNIVANLKYNSLISLVTTPDLSQLLGSNAPKVTNVLVPKGQLDAFIPLLPGKLQDIASKVNIEQLFSIGVPSYANDETNSIFRDFVNNSTVIEKSPEVVRGVLSYHYELNANKTDTNKFITQFIDTFTFGLSDAEKNTLNERLGAISLDSFEVWVGEQDNRIHQYEFKLTTPLSRLIGLDDKGIAGNQVSLDFKTTYYDFDVKNTISIPTDAVSVSDFMKSISDMKIKDKISSFKVLATNFHNATGNYGSRSNPNGSCTNPNPGSMFSPVGNPSGASNAVSYISSLMNDILNTTNGALYCYSTPSAWALAAPLAVDPATLYCSDNTGKDIILNKPPTGASCK
ncbi:MAG: hypothetical protein KGI58_00585 [Patescibacteria group bacterium]|nr:hypothetical protein [Patescibacteria group bacterium]